MADNTPQNFGNHTRFDPLFHFFMMPLSAGLLVWAVTHMYRHMRTETIALAVFALLLTLAIFKTRLYALKVQDRVIRLEERLRLMHLAPGGTAIESLREGQLVALRFAADDELPSLAEKAVAGSLTPKQIKQSIQNWRPDHWRV